MLLILREEILCLIILGFLLFYYYTNKITERGSKFPQVLCYGISHVVFDILTVITVNNPDVFSSGVNRFLHMFFYFTGVAFGSSFYNYVIHLCGLYNVDKHVSKYRFVLLVVYAGLLLFLPIEYVQGNGTYYSDGILVYVGFLTFLIYCGICVFFLFYSWNKLSPRLHYALFPLIPFVLGLILWQAMVPELLMTSGVVTLICVAMFVALDNPDKQYKEQATWDFLTGLKNRNCYEKDLKMYAERYGEHNRRRVGFIVADLNNLKKINDEYGHIDGDRLITSAAEALRDNLKHAEQIYRVGGDEFVAIYLSPDDDAVLNDMKAVRDACALVTNLPVPLELAMGYHAGVPQGDLSGIFEVADKLMYENKQAMKATR